MLSFSKYHMQKLKAGSTILYYYWAKTYAGKEQVVGQSILN